MTVEKTKRLIEVRAGEFCLLPGAAANLCSCQVGKEVHIQYSMSASLEPVGPVIENEGSQGSVLLTKRQLSCHFLILAMGHCYSCR